MPEYLRAETLDQALAHLAAGPARLLAGGTDLYPGAGARLDGTVLDLTGIAAMSGMRALPGGGIEIGACTLWSAIAEAGLPPALAALQQAARAVGGRQIQNAGTIGGNLCNASPAADGIPPLLACDAEVELAAPQGRRRLPLAAFVTGPRRTALRPDEILRAVHLPAAGLDGGSAFVKLGARAYLVISIAMVAARVVMEGGRVARAAVAVGACSAVAQRLSQVEHALVGATPGQLAERIREGDVAAALQPIDDMRATARYRSGAAVELVRRAVLQAAGASA